MEHSSPLRGSQKCQKNAQSPSAALARLDIILNYELLARHKVQCKVQKCIKTILKLTLNIIVDIRSICFHWVTLVGTEKNHEVGVQIRKIFSTVTEESWLILQWLRNPSGLLPPKKLVIIFKLDTFFKIYSTGFFTGFSLDFWYFKNPVDFCSQATGFTSPVSEWMNHNGM